MDHTMVTDIVPIMSLWMPIIVSAVFVFVASSIIHMFLGYHFNDYKKAPDEAKLMDAVRGFNLMPGEYFVPRADSPRGFKDAAFQEKMSKGPIFTMSVWPAGRPSMNKSLVQWFAYCVVIGIFAAYVSGRALGHGADYLHVFRFAGVTAFVCYAMAGWQETIWARRPVSRSLLNTFDALIYALLTAGVFGWMWPR